MYGCKIDFKFYEKSLYDTSRLPYKLVCGVSNLVLLQTLRDNADTAAKKKILRKLLALE